MKMWLYWYLGILYSFIEGQENEEGNIYLQKYQQKIDLY